MPLTIEQMWGQWMKSNAKQLEHYRREFDRCPILWEGSLDGTEKVWRILYIGSETEFGAHLPSYQRPGKIACSQIWPRGWIENGKHRNLFDVDRAIRRAKKGKLPVYKVKRAKHDPQADSKKSKEAEAQAQLAAVVARCRRGVRDKPNAGKPVADARPGDTLRSRERGVVDLQENTFTLRERDRQPEVANGALRSRLAEPHHRPRKKKQPPFKLRSRRR